MRVTIEHREEVSGLLKDHKDCYVDCTVELSNEERAIIKERGLYAEGFTIRTSTPLPSKTAFFGTNILRFIGRLMIVGGLFYGFLVEGLGGAKSNYGAPLLFIGVGLEIYGWLRTRREDKRFEEDDQTVTIKQLLSKPTFTVHAWNAGYAKGTEEEIRDKLTSLKSLIQSSATLNTKQTFEL
jgi:hypothetical protein